MRHTFISRLAENPNVSQQTIKTDAGHISWQMLERYSHIRSQTKQALIRALDQSENEPIFELLGHKNGTVDVSRRGRARALSEWEKMVGPLGFEPRTNGL
jgi:hypothetical protein